MRDLVPRLEEMIETLDRLRKLGASVIIFSPKVWSTEKT